MASQWRSHEYIPVTWIETISNLQQYLSKMEKNPRDIHSIEDLRNVTRIFPAEKYPSRNTHNRDTAIEQPTRCMKSEFIRVWQAILTLNRKGRALEMTPKIPTMMSSPIIPIPLGVAPLLPSETRKGWNEVEKTPEIPFGISFESRSEIRRL